MRSPMTLSRVRDRDGAKISREVADRLIEAIELAMSERRHRARGKAREAAHV
jgi:hypothetical protein